MKHRLKIAITAIAMITVHATASRAGENVPIPQKRPEKLTVSPSYIKQLMERQKQNNSAQPEEKQETKQESFDSLFDEEIDIEDSRLKKIEAQDIVELLERDVLISQSERLNAIEPAAASNASNYIPIPQKKPGSKESKPVTRLIKSVEKEKKKDSGAAIVSFALQPDQVKLDYDLQSFLSDHALEIFKRDSQIKLDIQAYAKTENGDQSSNVRLSLARALEVRKYLMKQGVSPSRLKLSAIGSDKHGTNSNRIDLVFAKDI